MTRSVASAGTYGATDLRCAAATWREQGTTGAPEGERHVSHRTSTEHFNAGPK